MITVALGETLLYNFAELPDCDFLLLKVEEEVMHHSIFVWMPDYNLAYLASHTRLRPSFHLGLRLRRINGR